MDEGTVAVCDEAQELQPRPCADICAEVGLNEVGCLGDAGEASCWCTTEGTCCEPSSTPACVDDATLAACETACGGPAACDPAQQPPVCVC